MPHYAQFNSSGVCIGTTNADSAPEGFEIVDFGHINIKKEDGVVRELTSDEITALDTANVNRGTAAKNRAKRERFLNESDWIVTKALEAGEAVPSAWVTYRTALRNLPTHSNWPNLADSDWPTEPS